MRIEVIIWLIVVILFTASLATFSADAASEVKQESCITVYNPFNMWAELELKCNWDGKKFRWRRLYSLPGRSHVMVTIPNNSKCQLWPKIE